MSSKTPVAIDNQFRQHIESKYSPIPKDDEERLVDSLISLMEYGRDRRQSLTSFLEQVARLIFRFLAFDEIVIGLYDRKQDDFYHEVVFGFHSGITSEYKKVRYSHEDMVSQERFPFVKIGKLSEFSPVEGLPEEERKLFNRPFAGGLARGAVDEFHEGDYIDFWMTGPQNSIIGWIELAKTRNGKLPTRMNVRWVELIASICSSVVRQRWLHEDTLRRQGR